MAKAESLARWMRTQVSASGSRGLIVELSGSVDSAVVARLAQLACPGAVVGVRLPSSVESGDAHAQLFAERFSLPTLWLDLGPAREHLIGDVQGALEQLPRDLRDAAQTNASPDAAPADALTPRLRMTILYFLAGALEYLVAGRANRSDMSVGAFTKHGEDAVDLLPLAHANKAEVIALARDLNVPDEIIERAQMSVPATSDVSVDGAKLTYTELQRYLDEGPEGVSPALAMRIERMIRNSERKRAPAAMPEID